MSASSSGESEENWAGKKRRWMRPPRKLILTTAGRFFILLTLAVGFGAVNTGNNLLFLLMGMMLSLMIASGILSEGVLKSINATRKTPHGVRAGVAAPGSYQITNLKGFASLSLTVADRRARCTAGPLKGQLTGKARPKWWKVWKKPLTDADFVSSGYTMRIEGGATSVVSARFTFPERGVYSLERISVGTRFPFSLFDKSREFDSTSEVLVFPASLDASEWAAEVYSRFGDVDSQRAGQGDEFFGLREYRQGEDKRGVHWKVSAKRGALVVRENEEQVQRAIEIVLCDLSIKAPTAQELRQFESAVKRVAGLTDLLSARGYRVGFANSVVSLSPSDGRGVERIFSELAVIKLHQGNTLIERPNPSVGRIAIGLPSALSQFVEDADLTFPLTADV